MIMSAAAPSLRASWFGEETTLLTTLVSGRKLDIAATIAVLRACPLCRARLRSPGDQWGRAHDGHGAWRLRHHLCRHAAEIAAQSRGAARADNDVIDARFAGVVDDGGRGIG